MYNILSINQKITISQNSKLCPGEIINHIGKQAIIKGFRKVDQYNAMPLVEFHNKTRMWILHEESQSFKIKSI